MVKCTRCKEHKEASEFGKEKRRPSGLRHACKTCTAIYKKQYRVKTEAHIKEYNRTHWYSKEYQERRDIKKHRNLKRNHGISLDTYSKMVDNQQNLCAICKNPGIDKYGLVVDHDHTTGKIRGLICQRHNLMLGQAQDNEEVLMNAIYYLRKFKEIG